MQLATCPYVIIYQMTLAEVHHYHTLSLPRQPPPPSSPPRHGSPGSTAGRPGGSPSVPTPHQRVAPPPRPPVVLFHSSTVDHSINPVWDEDVIVDLGVTVTDFTTLSDFPTLRIEVGNVCVCRFMCLCMDVCM